MASPDLSYAFGEITAEERDRLIAERERERLKNSFVPTSAADFEKEVKEYFIDDNARFFTWEISKTKFRFTQMSDTCYILEIKKPSTKWKSFKYSSLQKLFDASYAKTNIRNTFINQRVYKYIFFF